MAGQHLGVTPPISTSPPTARDLEVSTTLLQELKDRNVYEGPEEARTRELVLGQLNTLVKQFVYRSSISHGFTEAKAREAGGKIFTFGSYRLGVHGPGADIDTLCVVPKHVERDEFFTLFEEMLTAAEGVVEVTVSFTMSPLIWALRLTIFTPQAVPDAYVPIIKCTISGIDIDLTFARLALPMVPDELELHDNDLLRNLDERCVRSLGGSRVTDEILRLVPNVPVFREALRTIKLWAKRGSIRRSQTSRMQVIDLAVYLTGRAIYSNVMGFCGGVAWAMLVARICQLYPMGCLGSIISRFFIIMHQWQWPQPVLLKNIEEGPLAVRVWNPRLYPSDRSHRMPIITPAYPAMCSTHNVTVSTQSVMTAEFKRASDIVDKVFVGSVPWSDLFLPDDFFTQYRYYLQVTAMSSSAETQLKWSGTVESRIRQLVMKLEYVETIKLAHPYLKGFDQVSHCLTVPERELVARGDIPLEVSTRTEADLTTEAAGTVWTTTFFIGLVIDRNPGASAKAPKKLDISYPTNEFTKLVKMWDKYDPNSMGVMVRYMKAGGLPTYVHDGRQIPIPHPEPSKTGGTKRSKNNKQAALNTTNLQPEETEPLPMDEENRRSAKKIRSSSFVPENHATLPGVSPTPEASPLSVTTALAAATAATEGTLSDSNNGFSASSTRSGNGTLSLSPEIGTGNQLPGFASVGA
ncbi:poly(A) polymerase, partial [Phenoliferia sp. Uapishka_3]